MLNKNKVFSVGSGCRWLLVVWLGCFQMAVSAAGAAVSRGAESASAACPMGSWQVVPLPQHVQLIEGEEPFCITSQTTISFAAANERLARNARFLAENIRELAGVEVKLSPARPRRRLRTSSRESRIVLLLDTTIAHAEGYRIEATSGELRVAGRTEEGVFRAIQTVTKAMGGKVTRYQSNKVTWYQSNKVALPAAIVSDEPRFAWRGFLIDVGRHFFTIDYLKELIDIMALHGINYFHWHLTEDQGWRLAISKYPWLETVGQHRPGTVAAPGSDELDGQPVSGFYTQEEARELVSYAAERYITVVPEIDLPGHSLAALASYPQLGCTGGPYEVACRFGVFDDVLCGGSAEALQFARDVVNEVMDVFPSPYIHVGGDECPKARWRACRRCQQKIRELGLADTPGHTKEDQLQAWFMGEIAKDIAGRHRQMMGWDEILDGHPATSAVATAWTSPEARLRAAREGHPTIVCPISNFYFSNPHWNRLTGRASISRVYDMEPTSPELTDEENRRIIGAEGCIWTEWVADSVKLEWQLLPRLAALAEVQWTQPQRKDFDDFMRRLPRLVGLYEQRGWNYKRDILDD